MDKAIERSSKEKILRRLGVLLRELGFQRTKPTFFTRPRGLVVEFVHLHKYRSGPDFRVHLGLRVTNDTFPAASLNGPDSHGFVGRSGRRYDFTFDAAPEIVERCATEIHSYVRDVAEPWFPFWRDTARLIESPDSPLQANEKECLRNAIESGASPERIELTRRLLGTA